MSNHSYAVGGYLPTDKTSNPLLAHAEPHIVVAGTATGSALPAVLTADNDGPYDLSAAGANMLYVHYSTNGTASGDTAAETLALRDYRPLTIDLTSAVVDSSAVTIAEIIAIVAATPTAKKYITASDASDKLQITSKHWGTHIRMFVTGGAVAVLGATEITDATSVVGAGVPTTATITVKDKGGRAVPYAIITADLFDATTADTKESGGVLQGRFSYPGAFTAGEFTNAGITIQCNKWGMAMIDALDSGASAQSGYIDVVVTSSNESTGRTLMTLGA